MKRIKTLNKQIGTTLNEMYDSVIAYIEKHQGEKGYINTQDGGNDTMYFYAYKDDDYIGNELFEGRICAIRVKDGDIQILGTIFNSIRFEESDIEKATRLTDNIDNAYGEYDPYLTITGDWENFWQSIYGGDSIIYAQTIMSIGESIEQYENN